MVHLVDIHLVHVVDAEKKPHLLFQGTSAAHRQPDHEVIEGYSPGLVAVQSVEQAVCTAGGTHGTTENTIRNDPWNDNEFPRP